MAPSLIAFTPIAISPWPVMNTTGSCRPWVPMLRWNSSPLWPGMRTSSTRQAGASSSSWSRNAWGEAKALTCSPIDANRSSSAARTEGSSSIT
ncbi:hypothetical protein G6F50_018097 [Rhizopus delemar]|uniref:Uncharacterized protein n=1 Tax=Rhizopus delemar TaxID=936053 RepID=A0A9P6XNS7_9FUNG|nr:hypothetical protein G6F50_018097 [Rhizopus delemar]